MKPSIQIHFKSAVKVVRFFNARNHWRTFLRSAKRQLSETYLHLSVFRLGIRRPWATCEQHRNARTKRSGTTFWHRAGISWFLCWCWVCWSCSWFIWEAQRERLISLVKTDSRASWSSSAGRQSHSNNPSTKNSCKPSGLFSLSSLYQHVIFFGSVIESLFRFSFNIYI